MLKENDSTDSKIEQKLSGRKSSPRNQLSYQHIRTPSPRLLRPNLVRQQRQLDAEEAERLRIDKEGLIVLKIKMSDLFSKQGSASTCMESPVEDLKRLELHVSTSKSLPAHLLRDLKPITLTVEKIAHLPDTPLSHQELNRR